MSYYCHGSDFTINYGVICTIFEAGQFQQIVFSFKYNSNPYFKFVRVIHTDIHVWLVVNLEEHRMSYFSTFFHLNLMCRLCIIRSISFKIFRDKRSK